MRVGLVTRNTRASVDAFLRLIGPEWSPIFDPVLTREFRYVKPDKRLLLHVAQVSGVECMEGKLPFCLRAIQPGTCLQAWGVKPCSLLMVGDSFEDVEVGNAAGTFRSAAWVVARRCGEGRGGRLSVHLSLRFSSGPLTVKRSVRIVGPDD